MRKKTHQEWSWIFMILFIALSIIDIRFGLLGLICMIAPLYHAFRGRGKIHCSHYCPRGSLLGVFLKNVSLQNNLPKWIKIKTAKKVLLTLMAVMFTISLIHAGPDINKIGFAIFRLMTASLAFGILMGIVFRPRSWCQVCPMAYGTELISKKIKKEDKKSDKKVS